MPRNNGRRRKAWRKQRADYNRRWWKWFDKIEDQSAKDAIMFGGSEMLPYDFSPAPKPNTNAEKVSN